MDAAAAAIYAKFRRHRTLRRHMALMGGTFAAAVNFFKDSAGGIIKDKVRRKRERRRHRRTGKNIDGRIKRFWRRDERPFTHKPYNTDRDVIEMKSQLARCAVGRNAHFLRG